MDEAWSEAWVRAEEPLEPARWTGLVRAEALLVAGRLSEGLLALEDEREAARAAAELRATWLVRVGAVDEARGVAAALGAAGPPPARLAALAQVRAARIAERAGDVDAALLALERGSSLLRAEGAPWAALRVDVLEAVMRLARRRDADVLRAAAVCQSLPEGAVRRALYAWHTAATGGSAADMIAAALALPQRMLGAELLAAAVIVARDHEGRAAQERAQQQLVGRLEELGLALPARLRPGLFDSLGRGEGPAPRSRLLADRPSGERERLARLFQTLTRLARETELPRLLERITDGAVDLTGAERGFVLLTRDAALTPEVQRRAGASLLDASDATFSRSIALSVIKDARPIVTVDARNDPRLHEFESVHRLALTSVACVPIRGREGVLGALYLEHRLRRARFDSDDLDLLMAFADQAAIALEVHGALQTLAAQRDRLLSQRDELEASRAALEDALGRRDAELADTHRALEKARDPAVHGYEALGIVGRSAALTDALARVDRVRDIDLPVVFRGESGTGKELFARALHASGRRRAGPFVAVSCGALSETLLESELFGHVRGAFTGAERARDGVFVRARGGTLFLDGLEDMPSKMQLDLLRVLQERRVRPLGSDDDIAIDVRILGATRRPLAECVAEGTFREDLLYRLQVVEVVLPPLRDRLTDLPLLVAHWLGQHGGERGRARLRVTPQALGRLAQSGLPGNVRQLEHLLTSASVLTDGPTLDAALFDQLLSSVGGAPVLSPATSEHLPPELSQLTTDDARVPSEVPPPVPTNEADWKALERQRILVALEATGWNRARAAAELGMPRRTFYRRLNEHGIL